ncbi:MAG: Flavobacterium phage vB FspS snusmum6 [Candidatus Parcubacteria bacterium]
MKTQEKNLYIPWDNEKNSFAVAMDEQINDSTIFYANELIRIIAKYFFIKPAILTYPNKIRKVTPISTVSTAKAIFLSLMLQRKQDDDVKLIARFMSAGMPEVEYYMKKIRLLTRVYGEESMALNYKLHRVEREFYSKQYEGAEEKHTNIVPEKKVKPVVISEIIVPTPIKLAKLPTTISHKEMLPFIFQKFEGELEVSEEDLKSRNRKRYVVDARKIFGKITYELFSISKTELGRMLNRRHATVSHWLKCHDNFYQFSADYRNNYNKLSKIINDHTIMIKSMET